MDIFCEQLVSIKRSPAKNALMALSVIVTAAVCVLLFIYSVKYYMLIFLIVALIYGEIKLLGTFRVEYEYIITNGTVDIDKITAKSSRKRVFSFECKDIIRTARINDKGILSAANQSYAFGNEGKESFYMLVNKGSAKAVLLIEPQQKIINAIKECTPKNIRNELFV